MLEAIFDPAINGADLALCLIALAAAYFGQRFDRVRNARNNTEETTE